MKQARSQARGDAGTTPTPTYLMALLTSTQRGLPATPLPTGSAIARPEDVYGVFASVMADRGANRARRDVIVSSWEVCHVDRDDLSRRPAVCLVRFAQTSMNP